MNETFFDLPGFKPFPVCSVWKRPNQVLFQTANVFLVLAYLSTHSTYGMLFLRSCLAVGSLFLSLYGWLVLCEPDFILWNVVFTAINAFQIIGIVWRLHPFIR